MNDLNIVSSKCVFSREKSNWFFWSKLQLLRAAQFGNVLIIYQYQYDYNIIIMELNCIIMIIITE